MAKVELVELQEYSLFLPDSNEDVGDANAFWYVNSQPLPADYCIFYGAAKEVVRCRDGYLISYPIPGQPNSTLRGARSSRHASHGRRDRNRNPVVGSVHCDD